MTLTTFRKLSVRKQREILRNAERWEKLETMKSVDFNDVGLSGVNFDPQRLRNAIDNYPAEKK